MSKTIGIFGGAFDPVHIGHSKLVLDIQNIIEEYNTFSEEIFVTRMNQIVNNDIFESARVNLNNLIF